MFFNDVKTGKNLHIDNEVRGRKYRNKSHLIELILVKKTLRKES